MSPPPQDILVVCSGNICRSPYGEALLRQRLAQRGHREVRVRSAGTLGIEGSPAAPESIRAAAEEGIDLKPHRSSGVDFERMDEADLVLVMEEGHLRGLTARYPEAASKIHMLSEYHPAVPDPGQLPDIFDPVGLPAQEHRRCFALIRESLDGLLDRLFPPRG